MQQQQPGVREGAVRELDLAARGPALQGHQVQALVGLLEAVHRLGDGVVVEHVEHGSHGLERAAFALDRDEAAPHLCLCVCVCRIGLDWIGLDGIVL